ncbi:MAG: hypothetical protein KKC46_08445 [Proteobacteria bacterium]|nr:hypothetical protein [Pseudomonadota bacterium]
MPITPKLTENQKKRLSILEPKLRNTVKIGNYNLAKTITIDIQGVLRQSGHETRLMQAKNWLFEAAMEAGHLKIAISGFQGIRKKCSPQTRVYLEATALQAICYIREGQLDKAERMISEVLNKSKYIRSDRRRRQFKRRIILRFEEEVTLSALKNTGDDQLDIDEIENQAGLTVQTKNEDEILSDLGRNLPRKVINDLLRIHNFSGKELPYDERKLLPAPEEIIEEKALGRTVFSAFKRVLWRSLCDPDSDIYKVWFHNGLSFVLNKKYLGMAISAAMGGLHIGIKALAISATALIIKMGIETYCTLYQPKGVMIEISEKD